MPSEITRPSEPFMCSAGGVRFNEPWLAYYESRNAALEAQLATVTRERDEAKEGWAGAEERLGDCIDAAKEAWAKHGGREIALGHQRARAETAERERDEVRAVVVAATAVLANWDAHLLDGPEQQKEAEWGKYWSPDAAMVNAEPMAGLRAALRSLNGGSNG